MTEFANRPIGRRYTFPRMPPEPVTAIETEDVIEALLALDEPSLTLAVKRDVLGERGSTLSELGERVRASPMVQSLLGSVAPDSIYQKWHGAHWVLADLADLGYPPGASELIPLRDRVLAEWLAPAYFKEFKTLSKTGGYGRPGVPMMEGRHRRCGSQQGNALLSILRLGLEDERVEQLAERLLHWQWPDGGWNCDRNPTADTSSFMETLLPMRALALYGQRRQDETARQAALAASEVFLDRALFKRRRDGSIMNPSFLKFHYPLYWHYDVLGALVAMAEMNLLEDPRCSDGLDLLESKRLPDGGWPAEAKFYTTAADVRDGTTAVDWGGTSRRRMNPWVTVRAMSVLVKAKRMEP